MHGHARAVGLAMLLVAALTGAPMTTVAQAAGPTDCVENPKPTKAAAQVTGTASHEQESLDDMVTLRYDLGNAPSDFTVALEGVTDIESHKGFTQVGEYRFRAKSSASTGKIVYEAISASSDDWANGVFVAPTHENATVNLTSAGEGLVSRDLMQLGGAYTVTTIENGCEDIRVIVPCGVVIEETRADVVDTLRSASKSLDIGHRWETTTVLAVEDVRYFGVVGAYFGHGDMIVEADMPIDSPGNTWVHEYVHARQGFDGADNASWMVEASAEYYAARQTYQQGHISREEYAMAVETASSEAAVLTEPATWSTMTPYDQGAVVMTGLDRRIRASDGNYSLETLMKAVNAEAQDGDGPVTHAQVRTLVRRQGNASTLAWFDDVTTTRTIPEVSATGPNSGLKDRDRSRFDLFRVGMNDQLDELQERIGSFARPRGHCSRGGLLI